MAVWFLPQWGSFQHAVLEEAYASYSSTFWFKPADKRTLSFYVLVFILFEAGRFNTEHSNSPAGNTGIADLIYGLCLICHASALYWLLRSPQRYQRWRNAFIMFSRLMYSWLSSMMLPYWAPDFGKCPHHASRTAMVICT